MAVIKEITFTYSGTDKSGKKKKGEVTGTNVNLVKAQLRKQGINNPSVKKKPKEFNIGFGSAVKPGDISIFTRQMSTMMKAGVPLVKSFEIVSEGTVNPAVKEMVNLLHSEVSAGSTFASALQKQPKYFDDLFCALVDAGEQSGALETMLNRIAIYKEKSESIKRKVKSAVKYPITILIIAGIVTAILLLKVVPVFDDMFSNFGADLPIPTQVVVNLSDWMIASWWKLLIFIVGASFAFSTALQKSIKFRRGWQRFSLKIPVLGTIFKQSAFARFARTLATTFAAGVPLIEALESAAGASGNYVYESAILRIRDEVSTGVELNVAMKETELFPPMLVQMILIGEQSGAVEEMLEKAAEIYEEEVDQLVEGLTSMMEPMIMAFLGVVIGGLVISMYLPIFQMGDVVG
ncbi:MAG: type II secretion system F family protein [Saccharospirillaceae bacterium]|nr:type II secretion system F family protein [Pseudomonadales bacterium]NRB78209.1 type II secretion system F family protein [Saccharospirillaceae bacterium]